MEPATMPGAESRFVECGGLRTHYYAAGSGSPVVRLHGGGAGADGWGNWRVTLPTFARHHQVFAVDMVGFGFTAQPDPGAYVYSQQSRVNHIIALLEALDLRAAAIVGKRIAERAKAAGVETVAFDRSGFMYHGRVKALAEAAREGGLKF